MDLQRDHGSRRAQGEIDRLVIIFFAYTVLISYFLFFFKNQCINYIEMHPNQRRLLIHLRDNQLKLVDIRM